MENTAEMRYAQDVLKLGDVGLSRTIYDKTFGFVRVGLTDKEQNELMRTIRTLHMKQFEECVEDAKELLKPFGRTTKNQVIQVAVTLFERKAPSTYTIYQEALARKIHDIKNGNGV